MNIDTVFNIEDTVFAIIENPDYMCSFCDGELFVSGADQTTLPCPKCKGIVPPQYSIKHCTIIKITTSSSITGINIRFYLSDNDSGAEYATGNEADITKNRDSATDECIRRNLMKNDKEIDEDDMPF